MPALVDGIWLEQYVEPQLLEEFKNFNDDFIGTLKRPNPAAIDKDGIKFNKLINNVGFHINKGDAFTPQSMTGKKGLVNWDKLDTDLTQVTDAELRAMAFDKDAAIRVKHSESFKIGVRDYAMHKLAPEKHVAGKMPILRTTGAVINGRRRLTYTDLVDYLVLLEGLNLTDKSAWHMILSDHHKSDLLHDRGATNNYRDLIINPKTGAIERFFNLKFFENNSSVYYDASGTLKSQGAVVGANDQKGSVFYYAPNTVYHIESVQTLFKPMNTDTRNANPTSEFRLHSYGLCDKKQEHGFGAIVSANE
ncbi:hypothetical protein [Tenacibaculum piscium]|uniref:Phage capsid protein n=2 Tax=Tenacibaculum piscium TaxID=1458515 RepID=A0A2H1YH93_9FLAO|nr:hypothetical protein [Tenacibaculum piscium]MBE7630082.1 hypothetical protein [Tenacibaculum piscium]MBE7686497.1 hypothetical protein [Tenacibaculum piscium]MBE7691211.1 hypothetical protein [Tenacibaculum piscium]SOS74892.1 conserved hypothetical protein [Tenacibaculum piscium]